MACPYPCLSVSLTELLLQEGIDELALPRTTLATRPGAQGATFAAVYPGQRPATSADAAPAQQFADCHGEHGSQH
jgi:hypothetical protein